MISDVDQYIKRCIELAELGRGNVSPNPMVGCVIVKNGKVIGEGYHQQFGKEHAEVNAINSATEDVKGSTVYVNLEPCSIYGKTPPCTDLLIKNGVSEVICGTLDPNPNVNGKGLKKLWKAGIKTKSGVLSPECEKLNEHFFKYIKTGFPFVTLKIAQTLDAKISCGKNDKNGITSIESRTLVHKFRAEHDAILVGDNTIRTDNPGLTVRHVKGRQPYRVILSSALDISLKSTILTDEYADRTIIVTSSSIYKKEVKKVERIISLGARVYPLKAGKNNLISLPLLLLFLGKINISSLFVEGGRDVFTSFLSEGLIDKLIFFIAPKIYGKGISSFNENNLKDFNQIELKNYSIEKMGPDLMIIAEPKYKNKN
jgi:diaminohydroxyphosphoribosylaminopyrimidine deaminase / 5-amino-6-(5-phosphoribosylamino)uracil reductase